MFIKKRQAFDLKSPFPSLLEKFNAMKGHLNLNVQVPDLQLLGPATARSGLDKKSWTLTPSLGSVGDSVAVESGLRSW